MPLFWTVKQRHCVVESLHLLVSLSAAAMMMQTYQHWDTNLVVLEQDEPVNMPESESDEQHHTKQPRTVTPWNGVLYDSHRSRLSDRSTNNDTESFGVRRRRRTAVEKETTGAGARMESQAALPRKFESRWRRWCNCSVLNGSNSKKMMQLPLFCFVT